MKIDKAGHNDAPSQIQERPPAPGAMTDTVPIAPEPSLIDQIFLIRVRNNIPWKRLMEIALKYAPEETRAALREINANDRKVSDLLAELVK